MINKIFIYLFLIKIKYILFNLLCVSLFIQIINILEITKLTENKNSSIFSLLYLSLLKLPTVIIDTIPFVIIISTAFVYRYLISNNEMISMRNIGFSIIDIFKPIAFAIFSVIAVTSPGATNCPFFTLMHLPVSAAATSKSVCRQRNAGIWSTSATSLAGLAWSGV